MNQVGMQDIHDNAVATPAKIGLGGVGVFAASALLMHLVQPELNPIDGAVSYYMNGRLGWILGLGLVALGVGSVALGEGLRRLSVTARTRTGVGLLRLWGVGVVIGGIFPPDPLGSWDQPPSLSGMMHSGAAMVAFLAFPIAAVLLSRAFARAPEVSGQTDPLRVLAILGAATLVVFFICLAPVFVNRPPFVLGLVERVLLLLFVGWLAGAGWRMRRMANGLG